MWRASLARRLPAPGWRTRFAPAPTGYLHLGHVANAIHVWGIARAHGGVVALRLEDHDRSRCRPAYEAALLEDLDWLGFVPDIADRSSFAHNTTAHAYRQSNQAARYQEQLTRLEDRGLAYPCTCSRQDIARRAPHAEGEEPRYPGTCAQHAQPTSITDARRARMLPGVETFEDLRLGPITQDPAAQCGDVLIRDRLGQWTYQFAVTVDDIVHGIDVIIRGEDLLASTGRQQQLARHLGREVPPRVLHHALLHHPDGRKLSKAHRDTGVREWRDRGASPSQLIGTAAHLAGLQATSAPLSAADVASLFR